jgi:hypothetical protein
MSETIIQLLEQNNIPFNKKNIKDNLILIPGGVIKTKNINFLAKGFNAGEIKTFIKQIENIIQQYNMTVYILVEGIENINMVVFERFYQYFYQNINPQAAIIVDSVEKINVGEHHYVMRTSGAVWTFITMFDTYYPLFCNKLIYITYETWKRSIVIMTDDEIEFLKKYNIILVEEIVDDINTCVITQNTFKERGLFTFTIKYTPLNGGNRMPCHVIDGLTMICPNCTKIVYIDKETGIRKHPPCFI